VIDTAPPDLTTLLDDITPDRILAEIEVLERRMDSLRVLLRAARARHPDRRPRPAPTPKGGAGRGE
jgi:hypothetical protein